MVHNQTETRGRGNVYGSGGSLTVRRHWFIPGHRDNDVLFSQNGLEQELGCNRGKEVGPSGHCYFTIVTGTLSSDFSPDIKRSL